MELSEHSHVGTGKSYDESAVQMDINFFQQIISYHNANVFDSLTFLLEVKHARKTDLGYGYTYVEGSFGKKYVSIFYELVLDEHKKVYTYKMQIPLPIDSAGRAIYKKHLTLLGYMVSSTHASIDHNIEASREPLDIEGVVKGMQMNNADFHELMSPFSGVLYGFNCGVGNEPLRNRVLFNKIENNLKAENLLCLMQSINPSTRLIATEYLINNLSKFSKYPDLKKAARINLVNPTYISSCEGDLVLLRKTNEAVSTNVKSFNSFINSTP